MIDGDAETLRKALHPCRRYAVSALFVLLHLLETDPRDLRELLLRKPAQNACLAQAFADQPVDVFRSSVHSDLHQPSSPVSRTAKGRLLQIIAVSFHKATAGFCLDKPLRSGVVCRYGSGRIGSRG